MKVFGNQPGRIVLLFVFHVVVSSQVRAQTYWAADCAQVALSTLPDCPQAAEKHKGGVPVLRDADENAWVANLEYYVPLPGFNRQNRDIDVSDIRVARVWHFPQGWEFQFGGLAFRASGNRTAPSFSPNPPQEHSNAFGGGGGPLVRWNFLQFSRWRLFAEGEEDFILTNSDFPRQGTSHNGYIRGGGGANFRLSDWYWIETSFHWAHVSNGQSLSDNPIWNGRGFTLGFRRALHRETGTPQTERSRKPSLPILRNADETAWVTSFDYYAPQRRFDRQNRDIDVENFRVTHAWHFAQGWELQFGGLVFRASGTRTTSASPPSLERSDALGWGFGPVARWNFLQFKQSRLFGDLGPGLNFTNNTFPAGGTKYDFFLRAGAGASIPLNGSYRLEAGFWRAHISNGQGFGPGNPAWQGQGVSVGLRHASQYVASSAERAGKGLPLSRKADENAWVTEGEYFAPVSHSNPLDPGLNIRAYRVARAWHFSNGLEFQFGGLVFPSPMASGLGPLLRWNFLQLGRLRFFVDGEPDFIKTGFFFIPLGGDGYNLFLRTGGGVSYRLHQSYWLEAAYRWGHTLDGWNGQSAYSSWTGQGASLAIRHTFR